MDKKEKERLTKYGKLVCDFVNGKTPDDIQTSFFENLQSAFNFSSDFQEKALKQYPTWHKLSRSISPAECDLMFLLHYRNDTLASLSFLEYALCRSKEKRNFIDLNYDPVNSMFSFSEYSYDPRKDTKEYSRTYLLPESKVKACINNFVDDNQKDKIKEKIEKLIKQCHEIEEIKIKVTNRFEEIEKIAGDYVVMINIHAHARRTQEKLRTTLLQIIESDHPYESEDFKKILSQYNQMRKMIYVVTDDQKLSKIDMINENDFLKNSSLKYIINVPINYCLIEFLTNPDYSGEERISVCPKCNRIFSKSKLNGQQKYCPICSRKNKMTPEERADYMKGYRANPARKKAIAKTKREEKIRHYMANAGKTRKQAEIIVDNEI